MSLRQTLRSGVAAITIASVVAPAGVAPAQTTAPRGGLEVRVAQARDFSRIEFKGARAVARRDGQTLILKFNGQANPDISRLRVSPPKWLKTTEARRASGGLELVLTLAENADAKVGVADGVTYVNLFERPPAPAATLAEAAPVVAPEPPRPNPVPAGGVVRMESKIGAGQVQLVFPWANPSGAAVFRRGGAIWVVFDAPAAIDVSKAPRGLRQMSGLSAIRGNDYTAVRIESAPNVPFFASSQGAVWTVTLGPGAQVEQPGQIRVVRDQAGGPAALKAAVAGVTGVVKVADPVVGDTLSVVTALGPAKGLPSRREYVQMALLPSAQGLAAESYIEDLGVRHEGDLVQIGRPAGLTLSPASATAERTEANLGAPQAAGMPGLIDYQNWPKTGSGGFLTRYNALLAASNEEAALGRDAPVGARMAMARFLVGSELSFEAIGVLNEAARRSPAIMEDPEFRALRGIARVMARRYKEAQADFSVPILSDDPSAALWRSYIAVQLAQWPEARTQFGAGAEAFNQFSPVWKARFARSDAQAALALGDINGADARIKLALMDKTDPLEELATRLVQAKVVEAQGYKDRALRIYAAVAGAPTEALSAPATLHATKIRLEMGRITPVQAANTFAGLRYRWRGDSTELETIRALGHLYLSQGRYREALEALRSAGRSLPDLPEAVQLQADLGAAFRALFLDGAADGLEPVQALAMFYDFRELTPLGADGDLMVRKLVRRLVDVDLLDQAADLLKYQADNRLDGVPRAQVATDLALIYLMDRKPEQALQAINGSRTTILPTALNAERRLVEARALMGLGRTDHALEVIERDTSREGQDLRAEVFWKQKNWDASAALFEKSLGDRWKTPGPLSAEDEGKLLRTGVGYSLAGNDGALTRMQQRYGGFYDQARNPEALRVALSGVQTGQLSVADFGRATADNEAFAGWVDKMKARFREKPAPVGVAKPAAPATPPAKQAAATTAAKG
ncbi:endoglucanase [Phenylobacterium sp. Root700]|uniref:tetratricopeptide repeat protein n=1 Tax=Phenylobacterium sp. Root700 TaxID=1736591 RepID=UPI0009EBB976|nr:endoglucanase [Phenylobacterium sp. Root700]